MIELARAAARAAGAVQREGLGRVADLRHKGAVDLVTEVDLACEALILSHLAPSGLPVLAEEGGGAREAPARWIVDPLDGTTNYVHGLPHFATSIALERGGRLALGVVYDPMRDELFEAEAGGGARLNGHPLHVSACSTLDEALVASGFPVDRRQNAADYLEYVRAFLTRARGFRRAGAAALDLAWVAAGRLDLFWELGLSAWDVAAGALLVQEAGGRVTDMDLGPLKLAAPRVLASNGHVHAEAGAVIAPLLARTPQEEATWASR